MWFLGTVDCTKCATPSNNLQRHSSLDFMCKSLWINVKLTFIIHSESNIRVFCEKPIRKSALWMSKWNEIKFNILQWIRLSMYSLHFLVLSKYTALVGKWHTNLLRLQFEWIAQYHASHPNGIHPALGYGTTIQYKSIAYSIQLRALYAFFVAMSPATRGSNEIHPK